MSVFDKSDQDQNQITSGTQIIHIRDYRLASALLAVGIHLRDDPPFTHVEKKDGTEIWTYNFHPCTEDGTITAGECIEAWKKDLDWIKANPEHPFTFAMCMGKNLESFFDRQQNHNPQVGFSVHHRQLGANSVLLVKKGSRKHKAAIKRGFKQL